MVSVAPEGASASAGRRTVKVVPRPSSESTLMLPSCCSTRECTMAKPKPEPPVSRVREVSAR